MKTSCIVVFAAGLALSAPALADSEWAKAQSGNWSNPTNWVPMTIPNTASQLANIDVGPGPYTVSLDGGMPTQTTIAGLTLTQGDVSLDLTGNRSLIIASTTFVNNGTIRVNSTASASTTFLRFNSTASILGSGQIRLSHTSAQLSTGAGAVLTNTSLITGLGRVMANLINVGVIDADVASSTLTLDTNDMVNVGTMQASAGTLSINGIAIDNDGGLIQALGTGTVLFPSGTHAVLGGTTSTDATGILQLNSSSVTTFDGVHNVGRVNIHGNAILTVSGGSLMNDGVINVNSNESASLARLLFSDSGTLNGSGEVRLLRTPSSAQFNITGTLTHGASHTIAGRGSVTGNIDNFGVISADSGGETLRINGPDIINRNLLHAGGGGMLEFGTADITQTSGAKVRADAGIISLGAGPASISGGMLETVNDGMVLIESGRTLLLADVQFAGALNIAGNGLVLLSGSLINDGAITINTNNSPSSTTLRAAADTTISGTGTITLNRSGTTATFATSPDVTLTIGSNQVVEGLGNIPARLINNGTLTANRSGSTLQLMSEDKINNNVMQATNNGTLGIAGITISQSLSGMIQADNGDVSFASGSTAIVGGLLDTSNGGQFETFSGSTLTLHDVTTQADFNMRGNSTIILSGSIINDGVLTVNSNNSASSTVVRADADASLLGSGRLILNRTSTTAQLSTGPGATIFVGDEQTVEGHGQINAAIINNGVINANRDSSTLFLRAEPKVNNNVVRASQGGILEIQSLSLSQSPAAILEADDGEVLFSGSPTNITGGSLQTSNDGAFTLISGASVTLTDLTSDAEINLNGNSTLIASGQVENNGVITINSNNSSSGTNYNVADGSSVSGHGTILLNRTSTTSQLNSLGTSSIGNGQRVEGIGRIGSGSIMLEGTVAPGIGGVGNLAVIGNLTLTSDSTFELEIASTSSHDALSGSGSVAVDGTLEVVFVSGYTPVKNDSFLFISTGSVTGEFDSIVGPALPDGLVYRISSTATTRRLHIACGPDLNLDGVLDFFDVQFFLAAFSAQNPIADFNGDGVFDFFDVQAFLNAFSIGCP